MADTRCIRKAHACAAGPLGCTTAGPGPQPDGKSTACRPAKRMRGRSASTRPTSTGSQVGNLERFGVKDCASQSSRYR